MLGGTSPGGCAGKHLPSSSCLCAHRAVWLNHKEKLVLIHSLTEEQAALWFLCSPERRGWKPFLRSLPFYRAPVATTWPWVFSRGGRELCTRPGCIVSSLISLSCSLCSYNWQRLVLDNSHVFNFSSMVRSACWLLASRAGKSHWALTDPRASYWFTLIFSLLCSYKK